MTSDFINNLENGLDFLHKKGAFLTTKDGEILNTMTISWGSIGFMWGRPIFMVLVRKSRYTHTLIENSQEFTISIPQDDMLKEALSICGTRSGKDIDKFQICKLTIQKGRILSTPIISNCKLQYECKVVYSQDMDQNKLSTILKNQNYSTGDYHTLYYGEILACYTV